MEKINYIKEIEFQNNDIYFLAIVNNRIVINNNYKGILILDEDLNVINDIDIISDFVIYSYYTFQEKILLYCPESEVIVLLNVESFECKIVSLCGFEDENFRQVFGWNNNYVILSTDSGQFVQIDWLSEHPKISVCDCTEIAIHDYYSFLNQYVILKVFPNIKTALIENDKLYLIDYEKHKILKEGIKREKCHDYELMGMCLVQIGENEIYIAQENEEVLLNPEKGYIYLRVKPFDKDLKGYFVVLSSSNRNVKISKIEKYFFATK